jgi:heme/copper-type cytochrome/quinol oxidase subunit 2
MLWDSFFVLSITAAIFVVVIALLAYSVAKFRRNGEDGGRESRRVYRRDQRGLAWTVIPILIVVSVLRQQRE